ncbi:MAG: TVP38/TMEM64 family protein [Candidatus Omnitrophica bacterium]|nr:TVP38/TMEM64 family protein [Candidatus Omnitrophota bacterium]
MTITGGLAFGPLWGALAALGGATVRACSEFLVARLLGREAVAKLLKGKIAQLDQKIGAHGFKTVLLIRLIPNLPFDVQNYGLGFSQVRFGPYALASFLGMIPGSFAYVYLGYSLTDPKQIWKLLLAVLLIVGLMVAQRLPAARRKRKQDAAQAGAWKSRQRQTPATGGTHG